MHLLVSEHENLFCDRAVTVPVIVVAVALVGGDRLASVVIAVNATTRTSFDVVEKLHSSYVSVSV